MTNSQNATKNDLNNLENKMDKKFVDMEKRMDKRFDEITGLIEASIAATAKGFERTATKEDLNVVKEDLNVVKEDLNVVKEDLKEVKVKITFMHDDINNLKADTPTNSDFIKHEKRIRKLEKTVFSTI